MFLVISKGDSHCPFCGGLLKKRDKRLRIHRLAGGETEWYQINRLKCSNEECGRLHNELPDFISPYKHYDTQLIEDVVDGFISEEDVKCEDYPCEQTINHWKYWLRMNEDHIDGEMKSTADRLLDLDIEFARSTDHLLKELRLKVSSGWLKIVNWFLYNTGGGLVPNPA